MLERYDGYNIQSHCFETTRDLTVRRPSAEWVQAQGFLIRTAASTWLPWRQLRYPESSGGSWATQNHNKTHKNENRVHNSWDVLNICDIQRPQKVYWRLWLLHLPGVWWDYRTGVLVVTCLSKATILIQWCFYHNRWRRLAITFS